MCIVCATLRNRELHLHRSSAPLYSYQVTSTGSVFSKSKQRVRVLHSSFNNCCLIVPDKKPTVHVLLAASLENARTHALLMAPTCLECPTWYRANIDLRCATGAVYIVSVDIKYQKNHSICKDSSTLHKTSSQASKRTFFDLHKHGMCNILCFDDRCLEIWKGNGLVVKRCIEYSVGSSLR